MGLILAGNPLHHLECIVVTYLSLVKSMWRRSGSSVLKPSAVPRDFVFPIGRKHG